MNRRDTLELVVVHGVLWLDMLDELRDVLNVEMFTPWRDDFIATALELHDSGEHVDPIAIAAHMTANGINPHTWRWFGLPRHHDPKMWKETVRIAAAKLAELAVIERARLPLVLALDELDRLGDLHGAAQRLRQALDAIEVAA